MSLVVKATFLPYAAPTGEAAEPSLSQRPQYYVQHLGRLHPGLWRAIDQLRVRHDRRWPGYCFVATEEVQGLPHFQPRGQSPLADAQARRDSLMAGTLAAWRATQGVFRLDPTILDEVWGTPIAGPLPVDLLHRLPEWCPYVALPPGRSALAGYFVHPEPDWENDGAILRMLLDYRDQGLFAATLAIRAGMTLEEAIRTCGIMPPEGEARPEVPETGIPRLPALLMPLVSVTLYLCSETVEYVAEDRSGYRPGHPRPTRTRQGPRLFPPSRPRVWEVSYRLGEALRRAEREALQPGASYASPRAHIRRAHYHNYWTGPLDQPQLRRLRLRWLHPMLVNAEQEDPCRPTGEPFPMMRTAAAEAAGSSHQWSGKRGDDGRPGDGANHGPHRQEAHHDQHYAGQGGEHRGFCPVHLDD